MDEAQDANVIELDSLGRPISANALAALARNAWKPGQSGNPGGANPWRRGASVLAPFLRRTAAEPDEHGHGREARELAERLLAFAKAGDLKGVRSVLSVMERTDGAVLKESRRHEQRESISVTGDLARLCEQVKALQGQAAGALPAPASTIGAGPTEGSGASKSLPLPGAPSSGSPAPTGPSQLKDPESAATSASSELAGFVRCDACGSFTPTAVEHLCPCR